MSSETGSHANIEDEYEEENDATVESTYEDIRILDLREERQKEFDKPIIQCCGVSCQKGEKSDTSGIPRSDIMSNRMPTRIDEMRERFPKPKNCIPPTGYQNWIKLPLTYKIPYINGPPDQIVYSRGGIGSQLLQPVPTFTLHNDRIIKSDYNALHDPHAKEYFSSPYVRKKLEKQGLVSKYGEVVCSVGDVNQFREYLLQINNSQVNNMIEGQEKCKKFQQEQIKLCKKEQNEALSEDEKSNAENYTKRVAFLRDQEQKKKAREYKERQCIEHYKREIWQQNQEIERLNRIQRGLERDAKIQEIKNRIKDDEIMRQKGFLLETVTKAVHVHLRAENADFLSEREADVLDLEWLTAKMEFSSAKWNQEKIIQASIEADKREKVIRRQSKVERQRAIMPMMIQKRKSGDTRLMAIVRKYFNIWLTKTRERKEERQRLDSDHTSAFIGREGKPDPIRQAINDLDAIKTLKLDEFVMSIIKMRSQMKAEIDAMNSIDSNAEIAKRRGFSISESKGLLQKENRKSSHEPPAKVLSQLSLMRQFSQRMSKSIMSKSRMSKSSKFSKSEI